VRFKTKDEYVFTPAQALDGLLDSAREVTFFGHTHHQGGFLIQDSQLEVSSDSIRAQPNLLPRCALNCRAAIF